MVVPPAVATVGPVGAHHALARIILVFVGVHSGVDKGAVMVRMTSRDPETAAARTKALAGSGNGTAAVSGSSKSS